MRRTSALALLVPGLVAPGLLALGLAVPAPAAATCSCFFRRPMGPGGTSGDVATDPSYSPVAAVFVTRHGTQTVLTMETAYTGPPVALSMVIPVPTAITREQVRTVSGTLFRTLDRRTAPRVRHVWPACDRRRRPRRMPMELRSLGGGGFGGGSEPRIRIDDLGVDIEDQWEVDEYDMTLLSADESTGLLTFLRQRGLTLPDIAASTLRAYIESGHRFVLVDVDPARANRLGDKMMLSPIQLEYDSEELRVPVRLGTLNSPGEQELLLYVLSDEGRYEVANRPGVVAPTDLELSGDARGGVAELYRAISDEIFRQNPGAAVTEYARVIGDRVGVRHVRELGLPDDRAPRPRWTLTRIRHRYGVDLEDDLTLRPAEEPLRLTRRWRYRGARSYAPRGESGFHIQYVAVHRGVCASAATQRRHARSWATAQSLWEADRDMWPGSVLRDPIESLSIEPGSEAPAGWPPPPPEVQPSPMARESGPMEPLAPREASDAPTEGNEVAEAPRAEAAAPPPAAPGPAADAGSGCTIRGGRTRSLDGLAALALLALGIVGLRLGAPLRGRGRGPRRSSAGGRPPSRGPRGAPRG